MYQIENIEELLKEMSEPGSKGNFNTVLLGEDGVGKEYYAREIHKLRKNREKFLLVDFEVEHSAQKEQIEFLVTGGPECFLVKAKTNTFFLRRLDFLDQCLMLQTQNFFREVSYFLGQKKLHFMKLGILSSVNIQVFGEGDKVLKNFLEEFFVFEVHIPPLRVRYIELCDLVRTMKLRRQANCDEKTLQLFVDYKNILASYHWPGNLNELQALIERICSGADIEDVGLKTLLQQKLKEKVAATNYFPGCESAEKTRGLKECQNLIACCSFFS